MKKLILEIILFVGDVVLEIFTKEKENSESSRSKRIMALLWNIMLLFRSVISSVGIGNKDFIDAFLRSLNQLFCFPG